MLAKDPATDDPDLFLYCCSCYVPSMRIAVPMLLLQPTGTAAWAGTFFPPGKLNFLKLPPDKEGA
jgi:hypothetical protein